VALTVYSLRVPALTGIIISMHTRVLLVCRKGKTARIPAAGAGAGTLLRLKTEVDSVPEGERHQRRKVRSGFPGLKARGRDLRTWGARNRRAVFLQ
jgi:hypothetical protein